MWSKVSTTLGKQEAGSRKQEAGSTVTAIQHSYNYLVSSSVSEGGNPRLTLATSSADSNLHPHFFEGRLIYPRLSAELLSTVHTVVGARFFTPANMLAKIIAMADPVVTSGGGLLRFEGFSSCCSAYVRVDLLPDSYDGDIVGKGTTNVDFNAAMRAALARVRDANGLSMSVGREEFVLESRDEKVIEKKVTLPLRWIRGMLEVQSYQASMNKKIEVSGHEALRFVRSLPKASTSRTPLWVTPGPFGLRTTTREEANSIRLVEAARLRILEPLLPRVQSMSIYTDDKQQASAWILSFPGARLNLVLSAEVWRGFSGEGQALRAMMHADVTDVLPQVRAQLHWQHAIHSVELAGQLALDKECVENSLRILGASGLAGFDVVERSYFHRVLPFDLSFAEDMHPRLAGARTLVEQRAVNILRHSPVDALVSSSGIEHRVREIDGELRCTCPWFAKYQGNRGPCKHVLAVESCNAMHGEKLS